MQQVDVMALINGQVMCHQLSLFWVCRQVPSSVGSTGMLPAADAGARPAFEPAELLLLLKAGDFELSAAQRLMTLFLCSSFSISCMM